jgi:hypothetical protein
VFASCCVYEIKVKGFRLRNAITVLLLFIHSIICYMFLSYVRSSSCPHKTKWPVLCRWAHVYSNNSLNKQLETEHSFLLMRRWADVSFSFPYKGRQRSAGALRKTCVYSYEAYACTVRDPAHSPADCQQSLPYQLLRILPLVVMIFFIYLILPATLGPGVYSASNRN